MSGTQRRTGNTGEVLGSLSGKTSTSASTPKKGGGIKGYHTNSRFIERDEESGGQDAILLIHFFEGGC